MKHRHPYIVAVYVLPCNDQWEVLLLKRANTGRRDWYRWLVSWHMDGNETPREAMQREAKEEIGVLINGDDLQYLWTEYCRSDTERINIYFMTHKREGTIENKEPHKHDALWWFPLEQLPDPMDYPKEFIQWLLVEWKQYKETFIKISP